MSQPLKVLFGIGILSHANATIPVGIPAMGYSSRFGGLKFCPPDLSVAIAHDVRVAWDYANYETRDLHCPPACPEWLWPFFITPPRAEFKSYGCMKLNALSCFIDEQIEEAMHGYGFITHRDEYARKITIPYQKFNEEWGTQLEEYVRRVRPDLWEKGLQAQKEAEERCREQLRLIDKKFKRKRAIKHTIWTIGGVIYIAGCIMLKSAINMEVPYGTPQASEVLDTLDALTGWGMFLILADFAFFIVWYFNQRSKKRRGL